MIQRPIQSMFWVSSAILEIDSSSFSSFLLLRLWGWWSDTKLRSLSLPSLFTDLRLKVLDGVGVKLRDELSAPSTQLPVGGFMPAPLFACFDKPPLPVSLFTLFAGIWCAPVVGRGNRLSLCSFANFKKARSTASLQSRKLHTFSQRRSTKSEKTKEPVLFCSVFPYFPPA